MVMMMLILVAIDPTTTTTIWSNITPPNESSSPHGVISYKLSTGVLIVIVIMTAIITLTCYLMHRGKSSQVKYDLPKSRRKHNQVDDYVQFMKEVSREKVCNSLTSHTLAEDRSMSDMSLMLKSRTPSKMLFSLSRFGWTDRAASGTKIGPSRNEVPSMTRFTSKPAIGKTSRPPTVVTMNRPNFETNNKTKNEESPHSNDSTKTSEEFSSAKTMLR